MNTAAAQRPGIAILGAGAVGSLVAARLAQAGAAPVLIARGKRLAQLQEKGLRLSEAGGPACEIPVKAASAQQAGTHDVVMIALKAQDIPAALPDLAHLVRPDSIIVPLVNGIPWWYFLPGERRPVQAVDPEGRLLAAFDPARIVGAVLFLTSTMHEDGSVHVQGAERITLGPITPVAGTKYESLVAPLAAAFAGCRIAATFCDDIRRDMWTKVALNLATNPLSVVAHATLSEQFHTPALRAMVAAMLEETVMLARALGVEPRLGLDTMLEIGSNAGPFYTSMAQDYAGGRPLELGAIAHSVLELAGRADVPMPTARMMAELCAFRAAKRNDA